MLNIISLGHAYPETALDNEFLSSLPGAPSAKEIQTETGISKRYSSLSKEYISQTFNADPGQAKEKALCTPTALGIKASEMALKNAGLTWEDIGLIIGDGATPVQTTPGESQRVGNSSGLKIAAYDMFTPSAGFALTCFTLSSWKEDRVPKYVLSISSHTPTQLVKYDQGSERFYYGDGAAAVIFSTRESGIFKVKDAYFSGDTSDGTFVTFTTLGHAKIEQDKLLSAVAKRTSQLFSDCASKNNIESPLAVLGTFDAKSQVSIAEGLNIGSNRVLESLVESGNILSAGAVCTLSEKAENIGSGENIVCALAEGAVSFGYVLLEKA